MPYINCSTQLLDAYTPTAHKEYEAVQELARTEQGDAFEVMPWDWSYYSNKLKSRQFNINEEMLRPYFELSKVKAGSSDWLPNCMASRFIRTRISRYITKMWMLTKCWIKTEVSSPYCIRISIRAKVNVPVPG